MLLNTTTGGDRRHAYVRARASTKKKENTNFEEEENENKKQDIFRHVPVATPRLAPSGTSAQFASHPWGRRHFPQF